VVSGAIIDKNCRIGRNVRIVNERGVESSEGTADETDQAVIRDGIICVQRGAIVPDGWKL
jgi:glucose-1-phosphate adenylyltransferase